MLLWICFGIAFVILSSMAIMYCVMKYRKRKMALAKAIAEGKVSLKELNEEDYGDDA